MKCKLSKQLSGSLIAVLVLGVLGCKMKRGQMITYSAYIIGDSNDIVPYNVDTVDRISDKVVAATVLITTKLNSGSVKFCSGAIIASESAGGAPRVITNHHCFAESDAEGLATPKILQEACQNTLAHLDFNFKSNYSGPRAACIPGSLRTSPQLDLAVFALAGEEAKQIEPLEFYHGAVPAFGTPAAIFHYPSKSGVVVRSPDLGVDLPGASLTIANCALHGYFSQDEQKLDPILKVGIRHSCDLVHGSSGSALIEPKTGKIFGVNWGGVKLQHGSNLETTNVATWASVAEAFANGKQILSSINPSSSDALAANGKNSDSAKTEFAEGGGQKDKSFTKDLAGKTGKKSCGEVGGSNGSGGAANNSSPLNLAMIVVLLLPLLVAMQGSLRLRSGKEIS